VFDQSVFVCVDLDLTISFAYKIGAFGDSEHLDCPEGIAIDAARGVIIIANYNSNEIVEFDLVSEQFIRVLVSSRDHPLLNGPESVVLNPADGMIGITNYHSNTVLFISEHGQILTAMTGQKISSSSKIALIGRSRSSVVSPDGTLAHREVNPIDMLWEYLLLGPIGLAISPSYSFVVTCYKTDSIIEIDLLSSQLTGNVRSGTMVNASIDTADLASIGARVSVLATSATDKRLRGPAGMYVLL
jgi:DNA-binding beta-propeller fold protein YncE